MDDLPEDRIESAGAFIKVVLILPVLCTRNQVYVVRHPSIKVTFAYGCVSWQMLCISS